MSDEIRTSIVIERTLWNEFRKKLMDERKTVNSALRDLLVSYVGRDKPENSDKSKILDNYHNSEKEVLDDLSQPLEVRLARVRDRNR